MKKLAEVIKIGSIFAGAVLGAGFAGGRELVTFFVRFGKYGLYSSVFAGILFLLIGSIILYKAYSCSHNSFSEYLQSIFSKNIAFVLSAICEAFLLVSFFIMLSGGGAVLNEKFNIPNVIGSIITAFIVFLVLSKGIRGIGSVCTILTPIMIAGILYVDIVSVLTKTIPVSLSETLSKENFLFSSILYVSYNMLSAAPVLISCRTLATSKKAAIAGGIVGGIALTSVCFLSCLVLTLSSSDTLLRELPLLVISGNINEFSHSAYTVVLYMAILTTAFSSGLPIVKKLESLSLSSQGSVILLCLTALPLSFLKFSILIEYCYTAFGYLGLIFIITIIFNFKKIRNLKKNKDK